MIAFAHDGASTMQDMATFGRKCSLPFLSCMRGACQGAPDRCRGSGMEPFNNLARAGTDAPGRLAVRFPDTCPVNETGCASRAYRAGPEILALGSAPLSKAVEEPPGCFDFASRPMPFPSCTGTVDGVARLIRESDMKHHRSQIVNYATNLINFFL